MINTLYINISINRYIDISIYRYIDLSIYRYIDLSIHRFIDISIYRYVDLSIYRFIDILIYRYIDLSIFTYIYILVWTCRFKSTELRETEVLQAGLSTDRIWSFVEVICRLAGPGLGGRVDLNRQSFVDQTTFVRGNILKTLMFGGEIHSRRRSMRPSLSCKVDCWMHVCSHVLVFFSNFWGPFCRAWGAFGVLLAPRGAQADPGHHFFALFSTFGQLLDRFASPRGAKWTSRNAKATPGPKARLPNFQ